MNFGDRQPATVVRLSIGVIAGFDAKFSAIKNAIRKMTWHYQRAVISPAPARRFDSRTRRRMLATVVAEYLPVSQTSLVSDDICTDRRSRNISRRIS